MLMRTNKYRLVPYNYATALSNSMWDCAGTQQSYAVRGRRTGKVGMPPSQARTVNLRVFIMCCGRRKGGFIIWSTASNREGTRHINMSRLTYKVYVGSCWCFSCVVFMQNKRLAFASQSSFNCFCYNIIITRLIEILGPLDYN